MPLTKIAFLGLLTSLVLLGGCARVSTTTAIHADGSVTRKVVYSVSKANAAGGLGAPSNGKPTKEKPEDFFKLPDAGPAVKVVRSEDKDNLLITTTKEIAAGSPPVQDITLWAEKGKVMATSEVSVKKLDNGNIEYVETLHAVGTTLVPKDFLVLDLRAKVKNAIPAEYQKTETIDRITREVMVNMGHAVTGPPSPILMNFFLDPEGMARRVNGIVYEANVQTFMAAIPSLTKKQAEMASRSLASIFNPDAINQAAPSATPAPGSKDSSDGTDMTPLFFCVSFQGRNLVETNGLVDPLTGEVYWSLLPMSLGFGDVKLRLVVSGPGG